MKSFYHFMSLQLSEIECNYREMLQKSGVEIVKRFVRQFIKSMAQEREEVSISQQCERNIELCRKNFLFITTFI